jgi:hypothetical protein
MQELIASQKINIPIMALPFEARDPFESYGSWHGHMGTVALCIMKHMGRACRSRSLHAFACMQQLRHTFTRDLLYAIPSGIEARGPKQGEEQSQAQGEEEEAEAEAEGWGR